MFFEGSMLSRFTIILDKIGFQKCIKTHINIDSLPVQPGASPSLYLFFLQSCLHILSKVFRSTAKQPRSGVNQMWIIKNSKELLEHLKSPNLNHITSIKSFAFSTLYTTIPHDKLKSRLASIIWNSFIFKNGNRRYKYLVLGHDEAYFLKEHLTPKTSTLKMTSSHHDDMTTTVGWL